MSLNLTKNLLENISTNLKPRNIKLTGKVSKYDGNLLECDGFPANIGAICEVETDTGVLEKAEIVGFKNGNNCLSLFQTGAQVKSGSKVYLLDEGYSIPVGENLLGRKLNFSAIKSIFRLNSKNFGIKLGPTLSIAIKVSLLYFLAAS